MTERIHAPAQAYYPMAEILGDSYFLKPIPKHGVNIAVVGRDDVTVVFAMDVHLWQSGIIQLVNAHVDIRLVSAQRY